METSNGLICFIICFKNKYVTLRSLKSTLLNKTYFLVDIKTEKQNTTSCSVSHNILAQLLKGVRFVYRINFNNVEVQGSKYSNLYVTRQLLCIGILFDLRFHHMTDYDL